MYFALMDPKYGVQNLQMVHSKISWKENTRTEKGLKTAKTTGQEGLKKGTHKYGPHKDTKNRCYNGNM